MAKYLEGYDDCFEKKEKRYTLEDLEASVQHANIEGGEDIDAEEPNKKDLDDEGAEDLNNVNGDIGSVDMGDAPAPGKVLPPPSSNVSDE